MPNLRLIAFEDEILGGIARKFFYGKLGVVELFAAEVEAFLGAAVFFHKVGKRNLRIFQLRQNIAEFFQ